MDKDIESIKGEIIEVFPKLADDVNFNKTSPIDSNYNCIAWAYSYKDRWMWPGGEEEKFLDGFHYWPDGIEDSTDINAFIEAFKLKGYEVCETWEHEIGFQKIALYILNNECTHASRELKNGMWSSKLGYWYDIQHGSPYSIENDSYGTVHCFLKRAFP